MEILLLLKSLDNYICHSNILVVRITFIFLFFLSLIFTSFIVIIALGHARVAAQRSGASIIEMQMFNARVAYNIG